MTPQAIGAADWGNLAALVVTLWLFALSTLTFAINLLLAHAIIPSLAYTRHLPSAAARLRPLFYLVALLALAADIYLALELGRRAGILQTLYPRTLI